jgi:hypothetical protein
VTRGRDVRMRLVLEVDTFEDEGSCVFERIADDAELRAITAEGADELMKSLVAVVKDVVRHGRTVDRPLIRALTPGGAMVAKAGSTRRALVAQASCDPWSVAPQSLRASSARTDLSNRASPLSPH